MVIKCGECAFTEYRVYPGRGRRYIQKDGKSYFFGNSKAENLFHLGRKAAKLRWTPVWRRMHKKGGADVARKTRTRRAQKFQKAIVGMSLEEIRQRKAKKPELRQKAAAEKEQKDKAKKGAAKAAAGKSAAKPKAQPQKEKVAAKVKPSKKR
mmetsp:Transcript_38788/g.81806  ORF Transcript_38788/g.81806 Transcript_38788/m.81806 type:complete len:152 (-) Transcript_38788:180-635(-)